MRIAVDLDGVVYDFYNDFKDYVEYREQADLPFIRPRWDFYEQFGLSEEEFINYCDEGVDDGWIFRQGLPYEGAIPYLEMLKADGHSLHLVTHRFFGEHAVLNTMEWLKEWDLPYDTITFAKDKTIVAADLLLEDLPANVTASWDAGIPAVIMTRSWNEDWDAPARVDSWTEFYNYVTAMAIMEDSDAV